MIPIFSVSVSLVSHRELQSVFFCGLFVEFLVTSCILLRIFVFILVGVLSCTL